MRILMISDVYFPRVNGVSTSIETFSRGYRMLGHGVTLIAPAYPNQSDDDGEIIRIPSVRIPFDPEDRFMSMRAIKRLVPQLIQGDFDLVHVQTPFVAHYAGVWLADRLGLKTVTTYHTFFEAYLEKYLPLVPSGWLRGLAKLYSRKQCNQVDGVVSPSGQMLNRLREYGVKTTAAVIPTGLPASAFSAHSSDRFRKLHAIPDDALLLLYVGRVAFEKNIDFLFDMFRHVHAQIPDAILLVAGEGPALNKLLRLAGEKGLSKRIRFIGYLDRDTALADCYRASDVFVFASQTETQGLVLLEAMAAGLPVVSVASMGSLDVLQEGKGAMIAPAEQRAFAEKVISLGKDPARRAALSESGRAYAATWKSEIKVREMLDFYDRILADNPADDASSATALLPVDGE